MADAHKNFAVSLVATAPSPASSGTSLVVTAADGAKFPAVPFNATVWPAGAQPTSANAEIVRVTAISTDTFTITRAQESSSARTVVVGDQIAATVTAKTLTDVETLAVGGMLSGSLPNPSLATNFPAYPLTEPASGAIVKVPYTAGAIASQTQLQTNGTIFYIPLLITAACTVTALSVRVTTAGGTGSVVRLGLFNDNAGQPGTVLLDAGTAATTSSSATVTIGSLSQALTAGRYWVGVVQQGAPSPAATLLANNGAVETITEKSLALAISPFAYIARTQTGVTGALATAVPADWASSANGSCPYAFVTF